MKDALCILHELFQKAKGEQYQEILETVVYGFCDFNYVHWFILFESQRE